MLKIANFDLGFAQEDYAITNAKKYGGGAVVGRYFKQIDGFHHFAPKESFDNLDDNDRKENCFILDGHTIELLKQGHPIDWILPEINNYDIVLHNHTHFSFYKYKLRPPVVHWSGFDGDAGHPWNNYILLYRPSFKGCYGERVKYVKIGKNVPKVFTGYQERDGIFQCTQHCRDFDTISIAKECIKHKIRGIFAGPIRDYPLLDYIDNINTFYLGQISERDKLEYTKKARLYTLPMIWNVVFNQSAIEANGLGTPLLTRKVGWFNEYIKEGINGYFYDGENFLDIYNNSSNIDQLKCWESAKEFSIEEMTRTFYQAFQEIKDEWNYDR